MPFERQNTKNWSGSEGGPPSPVEDFTYASGSDDLSPRVSKGNGRGCSAPESTACSTAAPPNSAALPTFKPVSHAEMEEERPPSVRRYALRDNADDEADEADRPKGFFGDTAASDEAAQRRHEATLEDLLLEWKPRAAWQLTADSLTEVRFLAHKSTQAPGCLQADERRRLLHLLLHLPAFAAVLAPWPMQVQLDVVGMLQVSHVADGEPVLEWTDAASRPATSPGGSSSSASPPFEDAGSSAEEAAEEEDRFVDQACLLLSGDAALFVMTDDTQAEQAVIEVGSDLNPAALKCDRIPPNFRRHWAGTHRPSSSWQEAVAVAAAIASGPPAAEESVDLGSVRLGKCARRCSGLHLEALGVGDGAEVLKISKFVLTEALDRDAARVEQRRAALEAMRELPPKMRGVQDLRAIRSYLHVQVHCFQGVSTEAMEHICQQARLEVFEEGEYICRRGSAADGARVLLQGCCTLRWPWFHPKSDEIVVAQLIDGSGAARPEALDGIITARDRGRTSCMAAVPSPPHFVEGDAAGEWELCVGKDTKRIADIVATSRCSAMLIPVADYMQFLLPVRRKLVLHQAGLYSLMKSVEIASATEIADAEYAKACELARARATEERLKARDRALDRALRQAIEATGKGAATAEQVLLERSRTHAMTLGRLPLDEYQPKRAPARACTVAISAFTRVRNHVASAGTSPRAPVHQGGADDGSDGDGVSADADSSAESTLSGFMTLENTGGVWAVEAAVTAVPQPPKIGVHWEALPLLDDMLSCQEDVGLPLLRLLSRDVRQRLLARAKLWSATSGEVICREGAAAARLFVVVRGEVALFKRRGSQESFKSRLMEESIGKTSEFFRAIFGNDRRPDGSPEGSDDDAEADEKAEGEADEGDIHDFCQDILQSLAAPKPIIQSKSSADAAALAERCTDAVLRAAARRYRAVKLPRVGTVSSAETSRLFVTCEDLEVRLLGEKIVGADGLLNESAIDVDDVGAVVGSVLAGMCFGSAAPGLAGVKAVCQHTAMAVRQSTELLVLSVADVQEVLRELREGLPSGEQVAEILSLGPHEPRMPYDLYTLGKLVGRHQAFRELECAVRADICRGMQLMRVPKGAAVFEQGQQESMGFVQMLSGRAQLVLKQQENLPGGEESVHVVGQEGAILEVGEGAALAEPALTDELPEYPQTLLCQEDTELVRVSVDLYNTCTLQGLPARSLRRQILQAVAEGCSGEAVPSSSAEGIEKLLRASDIAALQTLTRDELMELARHTVHIHVPEGEEVERLYSAVEYGEQVAFGTQASSRSTRSMGDSPSRSEHAEMTGDTVFLILAGCVGRYDTEVLRASRYRSPARGGGLRRGVSATSQRSQSEKSLAERSQPERPESERDESDEELEKMNAEAALADSAEELELAQQHLQRLQLEHSQLAVTVRAHPISAGLEARLRVHALQKQVEQEQQRVEEMARQHKEMVDRFEMRPQISEEAATESTTNNESRPVSRSSRKKLTAKMLLVKKLTSSLHGGWSRASSHADTDNLKEFPGVIELCDEEYREGEWFGEYHEHRHIAHAPTDVLVVSPSIYEQARLALRQRERQERLELLRKWLPSDILDDIVEKLAASARAATHARNTALVEQGTTASNLWMIVDGQCACYMAAKSKRTDGRFYGRPGGRSSGHASFNKNHAEAAKKRCLQPVSHADGINSARAHAPATAAGQEAALTSFSGAAPGKLIGSVGEGQLLGLTSLLLQEEEPATVKVAAPQVRLLVWKTSAKIQGYLEPLIKKMSEVNTWHDKRADEVARRPGRSAEQLEAEKRHYHFMQVPRVVDSPFLRRKNDNDLDRLQAVCQVFGDIIHPECEWLVSSHGRNFFTDICMCSAKPPPKASREPAEGKSSNRCATEDQTTGLEHAASAASDGSARFVKLKTLSQMISQDKNTYTAIDLGMADLGAAELYAEQRRLPLPLSLASDARSSATSTARPLETSTALLRLSPQPAACKRVQSDTPDLQSTRCPSSMSGAASVSTGFGRDTPLPSRAATALDVSTGDPSLQLLPTSQDEIVAVSVHAAPELLERAAPLQPENTLPLLGVRERADAAGAGRSSAACGRLARLVDTYPLKPLLPKAKKGSNAARLARLKQYEQLEKDRQSVVDCLAVKSWPARNPNSNQVSEGVLRGLLHTNHTPKETRVQLPVKKATLAGAQQFYSEAFRKKYLLGDAAFPVVFESEDPSEGCTARETETPSVYNASDGSEAARDEDGAVFAPQPSDQTDGGQGGYGGQSEPMYFETPAPSEAVLGEYRPETTDSISRALSKHAVSCISVGRPSSGASSNRACSPTFGTGGASRRPSVGGASRGDAVGAASSSGNEAVTARRTISAGRGGLSHAARATSAQANRPGFQRNAPPVLAVDGAELRTPPRSPTPGAVSEQDRGATPEFARRLSQRSGQLANSVRSRKRVPTVADNSRLLVSPARSP
eukprot:TRINITY_DN44051_c0_g1_i1.p1 TRINITY_DN44051_c0_g1~~TRINITY_DN44051_c0_g1_i1.p1  ORF type:complete len:2446 (-),score=523.54 TRINITY_DN44051_c0_g1_i1:136-7473(-)